MDRIVQALYSGKFEIAFLRAKGEAFQSFFNRLMERAFRGDFMTCRPWGNVGDQKNDGFLKSERRLFQCYAPNEMKAVAACKKIDEDFTEAIPHWGKHFDKWSFVHNASDGLPLQVHTKILELEAAHPGISIEPWGLEELRLVFRRLELADLESWFGFVPLGVHEAQFGFDDIRLVLEEIQARSLPPDQSPAVVQPGKVKANSLSDNVATLLRAGSNRAFLVKDFFDSWHDETYGERLQKAFRDKYLELKQKIPMLHPNLIFDELHLWAGGPTRASAAREMAVLAVLAYFFDSCDIFEPAQPPAS
jgi:hypothetical protein